MRASHSKYTNAESGGLSNQTSRYSDFPSKTWIAAAAGYASSTQTIPLWQSRAAASPTNRSASTSRLDTFAFGITY